MEWEGGWYPEAPEASGKTPVIHKTGRRKRFHSVYLVSVITLHAKNLTIVDPYPTVI